MSRMVFERNPVSRKLIQHALSGAHAQPFWISDLGDVASYPQLTATTHYDLAIVGGGYTGLWSALLAKQRNPALKVGLFEATRIGSAASGRNGGFVEATLTHGHANGVRRWPDEIETLERLGRENLDAIGTTVRERGLDCDFERTGGLAVAVEDYQIDELRDESNSADTIYLDRDAVRAQVNSPIYLAGRWSTADCALTHPAKLAHELARVAAADGVDIFENTPVAGLSKSARSGPMRLAAGPTSVTADRVILATNAFPSLLKRYRYHTVPVYDYVLTTEPLNAEQLDAIGWRQRQGVADMSNQFHYYRLTADDRILWGGYDAIYHYGRRMHPRLEDRPTSYERLASHFFTTFPQLEGIRFSHKWAGVIDTSTRFCAFFGSANQGRVSYAAGFTGLGVGATRFAANVMFDRISGRKTELSELEMVRSMPLPFPPEPFAWVGVNATRHALDRADHHEGRRNLFLRALDALGLGFDS